MKKRILIAGMFPFLCAGKVFCVDIKDLFDHAREHHRCLLNGEDVGYACPPCADNVLFVLEETDTDRKDQEVTVKMDCEDYFAGCRICKKFMGRNHEIIFEEIYRKSRGDTGSILCDNDESMKALKEQYEKELKKLNKEKSEELSEEKFEEWYEKKFEEWYEKKFEEWYEEELKELDDEKFKELYGKEFEELNEKELKELCGKEFKELYGKKFKKLYGEKKLKELHKKEFKKLYKKNLEERYKKEFKEWYEKEFKEPYKEKLEELNREKNIGPQELRMQASFVRGARHMEYRHLRCFVCFEDFNKFFDPKKFFGKKIENHLWEHGVCKECGYKKVKEGDKKAHLKDKHGCDCFQPWSGHDDQCSSRLLLCDKHGGLHPIEHFRQEHRCKEGCEIRYDSKSGKNVIFHSCYIKCPECLKDVPGVHMDKVEECSEACRLVDGKWEHEENCRNWVKCELCTDKVVCATPLHMKIVHGCELDKTGCHKEGKAWNHGENCPAVRCPECDICNAFENSEFREHMNKHHGCSCKIINPSRGHEESCPCYKQCPVKEGCVLVRNSIRDHVKTKHEGRDYCPACKQWGWTDHLRWEHWCTCSKSMNEVHDRDCPCFLTCPDCEIPVAWDHMMEQHKSMKYEIAVCCGRDAKGAFDPSIRKHEFRCRKDCGYEKVEEKDKEAHLKNEHGCNCFQPRLYGHTDMCPYCWLWCNECRALFRIGHFQEKHRCKERCEITYDSKRGGYMILHRCYIKCPECLKVVPGVHMDDVERCSEACQSVDGKWKHGQGCRHWVECKLCTDKIVCATPLHMKIVHGCELDKTGCHKEGKAWKHGENCPAVRCLECGVRNAFENSEFRKHVKEYECSCKIINPSRGHEESCPCYKQ